jgi:hypothetical protein
MRQDASVGERHWDGLTRPDDAEQRAAADGVAAAADADVVAPPAPRPTARESFRIIVLVVVVIAGFALRQTGMHSGGVGGFVEGIAGDLTSTTAVVAILSVAGLGAWLSHVTRGGLSGMAERRTKAYLAEQQRTEAVDTAERSAR